MGLIGMVVGAVAFVVGGFMLLMALAMLVVYPIHLLWFVPLMIFIGWRIRRRWFKARPMSFEHAKRLAYGEHTDESQHHYVEPVTIGGHIRHHHQDGHQ